VVIKEKDLSGAESQLLKLSSLKRFSNNLKSAKKKDDFRRQIRRYLSIYLLNCPFEISGTNRYVIKTHKVTIIKQKTIKTGEKIKYLFNIQAILTEEETLLERDVALLLLSRLKIRPLLIYLD
jgi:histone-lysine N-methyltransferase SUV420H